MRAIDLLGQAISRDAHYGLALGLATTCHIMLDGYDWSEDRDRQRNRQVSVDLARRALQVAGDDANVLCDVANVFGGFEPNIDPSHHPH